MKHVVQFSGGVGSWATARRVVDAHGPEGLILLLADTLSEAGDWRPFVEACHRDLGGEIVQLVDGRDIWQVFNDEGFIANTRVDICSRVLKREPLRAWLEENCDPADTIVYLGFDWTEEHRLLRARPHWEPWRIEAPLCDPPYIEKPALVEDLRRRGIPVPIAYELGLPHNNCLRYGCIKGGQAYWREILTKLPEAYARSEAQEEAFRAAHGKDVAIMRDRKVRILDDGSTGTVTTPLTLREFRERIEASPSLFDVLDWGACSCMTPEDDATAVALPSR